MTHHAHVPHDETHDHEHGPGCGHDAVAHDGHADYLHDGHLHHPHDDHVDEHTVPVGGANPAGCTPEHECAGHTGGHEHDAACDHEALPHSDHTDFLVEGHLHHPHGDHCDDHGSVMAA